MGTRADFYIGKDPKTMEWLGSIAWDGYPEGIGDKTLACDDELIWRTEIDDLFDHRDDATVPRMGWPWPWKDSRTTDFAYTFDEGCVWLSGYGRKWIKIDDWEGSEEYWDEEEKIEFPDMSSIQKYTRGKRSGVLFVGPRGIIEPED